jgi:hypothetical protein
MNPRFCRTALVFALAGQSLVGPAARIPCDYVRSVTQAAQWVSNLVATSPRWGYSVDRLGRTFEMRVIPNSRSST